MARFGQTQLHFSVQEGYGEATTLLADGAALDILPVIEG